MYMTQKHNSCICMYDASHELSETVGPPQQVTDHLRQSEYIIVLYTILYYYISA